ncbi:hypothetical protein BH23GEM6_BH23GEM6_13270 [soil metagenome]
MRYLIPLLAVATLIGCAETAVPTSTDLHISGSAHEAALMNRGTARAKLVGVFNTQLRAAEEVPHTSSSEAIGHTQIKIYDDGTIEWMVKVNNRKSEQITAGHIHAGRVGQAGPVVQLLFSPPARTDRQIDIRSSAMNADLASRILADPAAFYINVHSVAEPLGAIRGQLR